MWQQSSKKWFFVPPYFVVHHRFHVQDGGELFRTCDNEDVNLVLSLFWNGDDYFDPLPRARMYLMT